MKPTPTARELEWWRKHHPTYDVAVVERWNHWAGIRQDLYGWMDIQVVAPLETIGIQVTSGSNHAARVAKVKRSAEAMRWSVAPGRRVLVVSWARRMVPCKNGAKVPRWYRRVEEITEFNAVEAARR